MCESVESLIGSRCYKTETVSVLLLALFCVSNATILVIFQRMDPEGVNSDQNLTIRCVTCPLAIQKRRFSLLLLPVPVLCLFGLALMMSSVRLGSGCLFSAAPHLGFVLVAVWSIFSVFVARLYEKTRFIPQEEFLSCRDSTQQEQNHADGFDSMDSES